MGAQAAMGDMGGWGQRRVYKGASVCGGRERGQGRPWEAGGERQGTGKVGKKKGEPAKIPPTYEKEGWQQYRRI